MLGQWMLLGMIVAVVVALSFPLFAAIERAQFALDDRRFRRYWRTTGRYLADLRHRRIGAGRYCRCLTCSGKDAALPPGAWVDAFEVQHD